MPSPRCPLCAALAAALIAVPACTGDLDPGELPWSHPAPAASGPTGGAAQGIECDDLPALTPEEIGRLPRDVKLGKAAPVEPAAPAPYAVLPDVTLSGEAAAKVEALDRAFFKKTGAHLVVTSGTRDASRQAAAMYKMIRLGGDVLELYKNKAAAREIKQAYDRAAGRAPEDVVAAMHAVIQGQIDRGVFISAHLRAGAVDIRNRTMSPVERRAFGKAVEEVGGIALLEESRPPHYHLQIDG
jgi:hypothetical protein